MEPLSLLTLVVATIVIVNIYHVIPQIARYLLKSCTLWVIMSYMQHLQYHITFWGQRRVWLSAKTLHTYTPAIPFDDAFLSHSLKYGRVDPLTAAWIIQDWRSSAHACNVVNRQYSVIHRHTVLGDTPKGSRPQLRSQAVTCSVSLTAYVTFEPPGEAGEGLVHLLRHQTARWTRSWRMWTWFQAMCPRIK